MRHHQINKGDKSQDWMLLMSAFSRVGIWNVLWSHVPCHQFDSHAFGPFSWAFFFNVLMHLGIQRFCTTHSGDTLDARQACEFVEKA